MAESKTEIINSNPIKTKFAPMCSAAERYVSMFRIDGVPILPPMMTPEKRRQMHKIKEKAIKVEQRLEEGRRRREKCSTVVEELNESTQVLNEEGNSSSSCSASEHESEMDAQRKEVEKSYMILSNLLIQNKNENISMTPQYNSYNSMAAYAPYDLEPAGFVAPRSSETNLTQRMQKLQKSETLIYDHGSNTLMQALSEDEAHIFQQQEQQINLDYPEEKPVANKIELQEAKDEENANLDYLASQMSKTCSADKSLKKIPSICIDPPTPINGALTFCDSIQPRASIDAINVNNQSDKPYEEVSKSLHEELSSDESSNCLESKTTLEHDLKTHRKVSKITSKILKFEHFSVSEEPPKRSNIKPPQRSATSPSLKSPLSERIQPVNKTLALTHAGSRNENGLVRSNSFTLDYPSKALIEHIRQQKTPSSSDHYPTKRTNLISTSITRDTVESKAKRVQKVDLKPRTQTARLQLKPSSTNITSPSPTTSYQSSISKNKRSPYDTKPVKPKIARQLKKSVSGTSTIKHVKPRPSMPSIQSTKLTTGSMSHDDSTSVNSIYSGIEAEHRKKFLELLAHQKREQQRMQRVFEEQQQYLLEQLTAKMDSVQIQQQQQPNVTSSYMSIKMYAGHSSPADISPTVKSDYNESLSLQSPSRSINSSIACDLTSLELSTRSSTLAATSQSSNSRTPRRRLFSRDISPSASNRSIASICSNSGGGGAANCVERSNGPIAGTSSSRIQRDTSETHLYYTIQGLLMEIAITFFKYEVPISVIYV
ncbi:serine-rich adhesin for platelets isoform X2 [Eurosta solidaginis]|uniref:serine-rich adhesin for platelets isoform X2 n=1 Tax=Eurosta solidaginis TaxID=178769 RepID=UPI00353124C8